MATRSGVVDQAQVELARRELARREFYDYARYVYRGYPDARHLVLLSEYLQQVELYIRTGGAEGIGRLMVNMPPRYWKSTTTSVIFPSWVLGRNPDKRIIVTSYNGSLAFGFSRRARNTLNDTPFRNVFGDRSGEAGPVLVSDDSRSVESWDIAGGFKGGMAAAGVGGGITGKGADLFIIDDPHKDRADAESVAKRETVWDWYKSTAYTRLEAGAAMIIIQTRWHSDDLSGRLLKAMATDPQADQWTVLSMPAIAEEWAGMDFDYGRITKALQDGYWMGPDPLGRAPGAALWPDMYDLESILKTRVNVGGYEFEALYQQRPQRIEGALIRADKIRIIRPDQVPAGLQEVRYWDLAVSERKTADYIAGGRVGFSADGRLYIRHIEHLPGPWADARGTMVTRMLADGPGVRQGIEISGQQGGYYQEFVRDEQLLGIPIEGVNPQKIGNKQVRAQTWGSRIQDGLVYAVDDGSWDVEAFISECLAFPNGAHDDRVDCIGGGVQMLGGWSGRMSDVPQDAGTQSQWGQFLNPDYNWNAVLGWDVLNG